MKTVGMVGAGLLLLASCATGPQEPTQATTPAQPPEDPTLQTLRDLGLTPEEMLELVREKWVTTPAPAEESQTPSGATAEAGTTTETGTNVVQEAATVAQAAAGTDAPAPPEAGSGATATVVVVEQVEAAPEVVVVHAPEVREVTVFYEALAPYGWWLELAPYGRVWRPAVAVVDVEWRPYCHGGRWLWTDWGWYWASSYSWGWITFHYGRWHYCPEYRWVWVPDLVWAPAWVTWRVTPDYCGWAPLPPSVSVEVELRADRHDGRDDCDRRHGLTDRHYTFVPRHCLHERDVSRVALPQDRAAGVYRGSRFLPDGWRREGTRLVNLGPRAAEAREQAREREHRLRLVRTPPPPRPAAPRVDRSGHMRRLPTERRESGPSLRLVDDTTARRSVRTDSPPQQGPTRPEPASPPRVASRPGTPAPRVVPADRTASTRRQDGDRAAVRGARVESRPPEVTPTAPPATMTSPPERPSRPAEAVPERRVVERRPLPPAPTPPVVSEARPTQPVSEQRVVRGRTREQRPSQIAVERPPLVGEETPSRTVREEVEREGRERRMVRPSTTAPDTARRSEERPVAMRQAVKPRAPSEGVARERREDRVVTLMPPLPVPDTAPRVEERPHPQRWLEAPAAGADHQPTVRDSDRPHRSGRVRSSDADDEPRWSR